MVKQIIMRIFAVLLVLINAVPFSSAAAKEERKTVRVGWFESPFNKTDEFGRRSGYAYEYQQKLAAYTGWMYEYVEGSWAELMAKLENGEIDLMSDVSFMEERTEKMLFSSLPMGTESYYVFVSPNNTEIRPDDYHTLSGKTIGVNKESIQEEQFIRWAEIREIDYKLTELTGYESEAEEMMRNGELDAFITMDIFGDPSRMTPIFKIGSSEYFFAVNKERRDLLADLDAALSRIQDENTYYNQLLHEKYLRNYIADLYLSPQEKNWAIDHGPIRVGYQDNYLAFCAEDPNSGELIGALKDYLSHAETAMENAHLSFQAISYPTASAAMEALKSGEIDCMFPANFNINDSEEMGIVMTPALMSTEMDAVVRASEQKEFIRKKDITVCVNEGNTNYEMFLREHFPAWKVAYYPDTPAGLEAIAAGEADCVIISNYRFNNISRQCEQLRLATVYSGVDMEYYFAVRAGDTTLYSILSKVTGAVPSAAVNAALTYYSTEDVKTTFTDLIKDHLFPVMSVIAVILCAIMILLIRNIRAERKLLEEERILKDLNTKVYVDALTSVRNKGAFDEYVSSLQKRLENEGETDFAIGVFDCNNLKEINDSNGHDKGKLYLKNATKTICRVFQHSPVFRIGGDEFAVVLQKDDFNHRQELIEKFKTTCRENNASVKNKWEEVRVAFGIAVYDPSTDTSVNDTVRRADKLMYDNKQKLKMQENGKGTPEI